MIARRALLAAMPAVEVTLAIPVALAARHPDSEVRFMDAVRELKAAAMAFDPAILGLWVSHDESGDGDLNKLSGIYFNRSAKLQAWTDALKQKRGVST